MMFLPFDKHVIETSKEYIDIQKWLDKNVYTGSNLPFMNDSGKFFVGKLKSDSFKIRKSMVSKGFGRTQNSFTPILKGKMTRQDGKVKIVVRMRINIAVMLFTLFCLYITGSEAISVIDAEGFKLTGNPFLWIFIFTYVICMICYKIPAKACKDKLDEIYRI